MRWASLLCGGCAGGGAEDADSRGARSGLVAESLQALRDHIEHQRHVALRRHARHCAVTESTVQNSSKHTAAFE